MSGLERASNLLQTTKIVALFVAVVASLQIAEAQSPEPIQTVVVTLTTSGMRLSQSSLKVGITRFVVVNQTPRPGLTLLVSPASGGTEQRNAASALTPSRKDGGTRPSIDVGLSAGSYSLWVGEVPNPAITVTVSTGDVQ